RKFDSNAEVITLEKGTIYSYGQCGLPYVISELIPSTDHLIARSPETFRQKYNIDARTNHDVHQIDPKSKTVSGQHTISKERSEEHTSELQSRFDLVCRLLLEKKKKKNRRRSDTNVKEVERVKLKVYNRDHT